MKGVRTQIALMLEDPYRLQMHISKEGDTYL